jgi:hypothetical protein
MTDKLLQTLGIETGGSNLPVVIGENQSLTPTVSADFEGSRLNLLNVMEITKRAIDDLSAIASQSQDPEAYASLSSLIKAYTSQQNQLLQLHKLAARPGTPEKHAEGEANPTQVTNQNLFVGSTAELAQVLEKMRKND